MVKKIYAVKIGKTPGKYYSWDECKAQVNGYPNAVYKSFKTETEADEYLKTGEEKKTCKTANVEKHINIDEESCVAYVDGSYNNELDKYGYGIVFLDGKSEREYYGTGTDSEAAKMANVAGEILAAQKAVDLALEEGFLKITICHDYTGIAEWTRGWKCNNKYTSDYRKSMLEKSGYIDIVFQKVDAHSGDKYNDRADKLAKKGAGIVS